MKVWKFMKMTKELDVDADAKLVAYDPDSEKEEEVTGIDISSDGKRLIIRTDED